MTVKEFLSVCDFPVDRVEDRDKNVYFANIRKYASYEDMNIHKIYNDCGYITVVVDSYGYNGEYERRRIK